jgi:uncharacterized protein (TIGR02117 family)
MTAHHAHTFDSASRASQWQAVRRMLVCAMLACVTSACASNQTCYQPGTPANELHTIYIVQRGWHTGVAIPVADWPNKTWPLLREFPGVEFLEFGWGDERFYQAETNTIWMGLRAALWPTSSVIHVIGFDAPAPADIQANAVVPVRVSTEGLRDLTAGLEQEFDGEHPSASGPQVHWAPAPNRFYKAGRSFYFPRMCNWWIAQRLAEAGCPIRPWTVVTASRVLREAQSYGERENASPPARLQR